MAKISGAVEAPAFESQHFPGALVLTSEVRFLRILDFPISCPSFTGDLGMRSASLRPGKWFALAICFVDYAVCCFCTIPAQLERRGKGAPLPDCEIEHDFVGLVRASGLQIPDQDSWAHSV